jgi:hypothetical protein
MEAHMKLLDEKGRLFGKLNIVDFLVILLVIVVAAVLSVKFLGNIITEGIGSSITDGDEDGLDDDIVTLTYTVLVTEVDQTTYSNVRQFVDKRLGLKDQLMASGDLVEGYIVDVSASSHTYAEGDTGRGDTLDLLFTIVAETDNLISYTVGTQDVRIGKTHIVKSTHMEFEGTILTCQWD